MQAAAPTAPIATAKLSQKQLEERAGVFRNSVTGTIWTISPGDSVMNVTTSTGFNFTLTPIDADHFRPTGIALAGGVSYTWTASGERTIELAMPGQQTARF